MSRIRANVHDGRHVSHFHEVHCMLERVQEKKADGTCTDKIAKKIMIYLCEESENWCVGVFSKFGYAVNQE